MQGVVDPAKEIERMQQKEEKLQAQLTKLRAAMAASDYSTKVPPAVQAANDEKVSLRGSNEFVLYALSGQCTYFTYDDLEYFFIHPPADVSWRKAAERLEIRKGIKSYRSLPT